MQACISHKLVALVGCMLSASAVGSQVAHQDESAANQGVEPATLQQALPQVHPQLQPFLGQMLAAAQMHAYGPPTHEQIPQLQALGQMAAESGPNTELQQQQQE